MLSQLLKASQSLDSSKTRVKATDTTTVDDILDIRTKDIKSGTIVTGYIWMGSGYKKSEVNFVVKGDGVYPASSSDYKILEKAWATDKNIVDAIIEQANDSFEYASTAIQFITDTEQHCIETQSQDPDIANFEDGDDATYLGITKHGEEAYLVLR